MNFYNICKELLNKLFIIYDNCVWNCKCVTKNIPQSLREYDQKQRSYNLYTIAEGVMTSVRSLQCSEGDVSDPIKDIYIYIIYSSKHHKKSRSSQVRLSVCTQTSLSVLKLSGWNLPKSFISIAGSV